MTLVEHTRISLKSTSRNTAHQLLATAWRWTMLFAAAVIPLSSFAQTKLYVVNSGADTISVINEYTGEVTATIKGPGHLNSIAYNPHDGLLYVPTHEGDGRVYLLDPATDSFVGEPITVGAFPSYITISPQAHRAYVSNQFGAVSVIDTDTRTVITEIASVVAPIGSALSQNKLYVVNNQTSEVSAIDIASNKSLGTFPVGCFNPLDIKVDVGLHKAFVTKSSCPELAVVDTVTDTVVTTLPFPGGPRRLPQYILIDSEAHRAYVTLYWGHEEKGMYGAVAIINTIDNSIVEEIELGTRLARMALDAPANRLYVTDRRGDRMLVVDTAARVVLGQVVVGSDPVDIAIVPERKR